MELCDQVACFLCATFSRVLKHTNVARAAEEEAREISVLHAIGREMEDAVNMIVQAAVEDLPFPAESYEVLHSQPGGVDLIIGTRCGIS